MIKWQNPSIGQEEIDAVTEVLKTGTLEGNGSKCREFERLIREFTGAKHALVVSNGTVALHCALEALSRYLKNRLAVTVPAFSYIATANTVIAHGHTLYLADSKYSTWNINTDNIVPASDVIIPVDIGGLPCDYELLEKSEKFIIEDAAEALGASYNGNSCGSFSDITTFSF